MGKEEESRMEDRKAYQHFGPNLVFLFGVVLSG
jgi:hypothetical protein